MRPNRNYARGNGPEVSSQEVVDSGCVVSKRRIAASVVVVLLLGVRCWSLSEAGLIPDFGDEAKLRAQVEGGALGVRFFSCS